MTATIDPPPFGGLTSSTFWGSGGLAAHYSDLDPALVTRGKSVGACHLGSRARPVRETARGPSDIGREPESGTDSPRGRASHPEPVRLGTEIRAAARASSHATDPPSPRQGRERGISDGLRATHRVPLGRDRLWFIRFWPTGHYLLLNRSDASLGLPQGRA